MPEFLQDQNFWTGVIEIIVAVAPSAVAIVTAIRNSIQSKSLNEATSSVVKKLETKLVDSEREKMEYRKIIDMQQKQIEQYEKISRKLIDHIDDGE